MYTPTATHDMVADVIDTVFPNSCFRIWYTAPEIATGNAPNTAIEVRLSSPKACARVQPTKVRNATAPFKSSFSGSRHETPPPSTPCVDLACRLAREAAPYSRCQRQRTQQLQRAVSAGCRAWRTGQEPQPRHGGNPATPGELPVQYEGIVAALELLGCDGVQVALRPVPVV